MMFSNELQISVKMNTRTYFSFQRKLFFHSSLSPLEYFNALKALSTFCKIHYFRHAQYLKNKECLFLLTLPKHLTNTSMLWLFPHSDHLSSLNN